MARRQILSLVLLALLVPVALLAALRARERVGEYRAVEELCQAVAEGRWQQALAFDRRLAAGSAAAQRAAECRCLAQVAMGQGPECVAALEEQMAQATGEEWLPRPDLVALVIEARQDMGDLTGAAHLAQRAGRRFPGQMELLHLEIVTRQQLGEEGELLADLHRLLPLVGQAQPQLRLHMAVLHLHRGEWGEALELLGEAPAAALDRESWYRMRAWALAGAGRPRELQEVLEQWGRDGAEGPYVRSLYAYLASVYQLRDPQGRRALDLLRAAVADPAARSDQSIARQVFIRLVVELVQAGRHEEAIAVLDRAEQELGEGALSVLERDDLLRGATQAEAGEEGLMALRGTLRFRVSDPWEGDVLWVTPDPNRPVDAAYQRLAVPASGLVTAERAVGTWPQRWVLQDARGDLRGAGTVWATPRGLTEVSIERRPPLGRVPPFEPPPVGVSSGGRVMVVILDCADWRFVQHGRLLGRLPVMDRMVETGYRAVMLSDPPYTAVALQSLLQPDKQGVEGFLDVVHQLGAEIEGLNFVGRNPFARLAWVLPGGGDLFSVLGSGRLRTVNLLHSFGGLQAGRHGQVLGPFGVQGQAPMRRAYRPLVPEEAGLLELLLEQEGNRRLLEEMAADFDTVIELAEGPAFDLVVLRVASFDVLTHRNFPSAVRTGQDDGELPLLGIYRYADRRLGELWSRLSPEDTLIVMSDHGIRTALEHDPRALFLAAGGSVAPGRAEGEPELRGFGRMLAQRFGVETEWPGTGIEPWGTLEVGLDTASRLGEAAP